MTIYWILGRSGIEGNEIADKEPKKYANRELAGAPEAKTLAHAKRTIERHKDRACQEEWESWNVIGAVQTYKELGLRPTSQEKQLPELGLKREVLGWLIAARSGHSVSKMTPFLFIRKSRVSCYPILQLHPDYPSITDILSRHSSTTAPTTHTLPP